MKELNEEIKLTLNLMQTDVSDGAREELQFHLYNLLDMKRDALQQRLVERIVEYVVQDMMPCKRAKPLTTEELKAGGWWCADVSKECAEAFKSKGLRVFNSDEWGCAGTWDGCVIDDEGDIVRAIYGFGEKKQIHRIGNDFYWSKE